MKLLINTSNLYVGGGVQVALSFINELNNIQDNNDYIVFLSEKVKDSLDITIFDKRFRFILIPKMSIFKRRVYLNKIEKDIDYDVVFTIFGPSYWKPKKLHLMGIADGWLYNEIDFLLNKKSFINKIKTKLLLKIKKFFIKKDGDLFVVETDDAKTKIVRYLNIKSDKLFVVGNTYNEIIYNNKNLLDENSHFYIKLPKKEKTEVRLLTIAHNYFHKNLKIIKEIIPLLEQNRLNIKFILSIDNNEYSSLFGTNELYNKYIIPIGKVDIRSCPSLYSQSDIMFLPTLLETFSANYPEAMKMQKVILTSNYSFAKDICKDVAMYFDPHNPQDIVNKIKSIINDTSLQTELIEKGTQRLNKFETSRSRTKKYLKILEYSMKGKIK